MARELDKLQRKIKRKRRLRILQFSILTIIIVCAAVACVNIFFVIKNVKVSNNTQYDTFELLNAAGIKRGDNLFSINEGKITQLLSERYPYVNSVQTDVSFPNTAGFVFNVSVPAMSISTENGKILYLDENFRVLEEADSPNENLMVIKGMSVNEYTIGKNLNANDVVEVDLIKNIISALKENQLFSQIKYIDLSKKYNILLMYGDLITIELGNGENLDKKIENTKLVIEMNGDIKRAVINAKNYQKVKYREVVE